MKKVIQCSLEEKEIEKLKTELKENKPFGVKMNIGTIITIALNELYEAKRETNADYGALLKKYEEVL